MYLITLVFSHPSFDIQSSHSENYWMDLLSCFSLKVFFFTKATLKILSASKKYLICTF